MKKIFITGIGTDVGKTIVSAIITEALKADYWKPVQSGDLENSDSMKVQELISNTTSVFHPEAYKFTRPLSPHTAAELEKRVIETSKIKPPKTANKLVIEGAGGLLVPLNKKKLMIDLIEELNTPVIVVSRNYLGSINHTLMTVEILKKRKIRILGLVINGEPNLSSENYISNYTNLPILLRVGQEETIDQQTILKYAEKIKLTIFKKNEYEN